MHVSGNSLSPLRFSEPLGLKSLGIARARNNIHIMKAVQILLLSFFVSFVTGCDKKSTFQKTVFTQPQSENTISLISETECEIQSSGNTILGAYSRQEGMLRVVIGTGGATTVSYFDLFPDGLRESNSGHVYLLTEPFKVEVGSRKVTGRMRTFPLHSDAHAPELIITDVSLETASNKLFFADINNIRAWDDETVYINNKYRYRCKSKADRDEVLKEIKAVYRVWANRFPSLPKEKPF